MVNYAWCDVLSLSTINTKELRGRPNNVLQMIPKTHTGDRSNQYSCILACYICFIKNSHVCDKRNLLTDYSSQKVAGILGDGELYSEEEEEKV